MRTQINAAHFCGLATSPAFLAWLHDYDAALCADLLKNVRHSTSCKSNTKYMLATMAALDARPDGRERLISFLRGHAAHVLVDTGVVFELSDPPVLTIPRRAIFESEREATEFLADKPVHSSVSVGGLVYVEYLGADMVHLAGSIPTKNWRTRAWPGVQHQN